MITQSELTMALNTVNKINSPFFFFFFTLGVVNIVLVQEQVVFVVFGQVQLKQNVTLHVLSFK